MTRNLKVLGLAITAVLAMSAVWAVSAQAADPEIHCTSNTNVCTVTGNEINTHTFTIEGGNVRCRSRMHATLNNKTVTAVSGVTTTLTECRAFGVASTVNMNGCTFSFANVAASSPATANVSVVCPAGRNITISSPALPCTINVGSQGPLPHVVFNNSGTEPTHVNANVTASGIRYTAVEATCPRRGGTFNNGTFNGETTLEGFNDNGPNAPNEGEKVGLHVKPL